jgi:hypothetical protein
MARIDVRMPNGEGIGANQTATFKLPIGRRYHQLAFNFATTGGNAFSFANLKEIRLFLNGSVFHRYSGATREAMNRFDGRSPAMIDASSFILIVPFTRYKLNTLAGEEETSVNTGSADPKTGQQITSFYAEIDIDNTVAGSISCICNALQSEALPGGPGTLMFTLPFTRAVAGAGDFEISDLPRGAAQSLALNRTFMKDTAAVANITRGVVQRNQYVVFDRTSQYNTRIQNDGWRVPQVGWYVIDKTEDAVGGDPIDLTGAADFRYRMTLDAAASLLIQQEYLGTLAS